MAEPTKSEVNIQGLKKGQMDAFTDFWTQADSRHNNPASAPDSSRLAKKHRSKGKAWPNFRTAAMIARLLEFGTIHMAADPFMTRAFDREKEDARDTIIAELKKAVDQL